MRGAVHAPGRGFVDGTLEMHCAVVGSSALAEDQAAAVIELGRRLAGGGAGAPAIGGLPTAVARASQPRAGAPLAAVIGIGDEALEPVSVNLADAHFLVAGPYRSGRSTALAALAGSLGDVERWLLAPRRSPLAAEPYWTRTALTPDDCQALAAEAVDRVAAARSGDRPLVLVVDDADQVADGTVEDGARDGCPPRTRPPRGSDRRSGRDTSGFARVQRLAPGASAKTNPGLLLDPNPDTDGDIFGVRLPRAYGGSGARARVPGQARRRRVDPGRRVVLGRC